MFVVTRRSKLVYVFSPKWRKSDSTGVMANTREVGVLEKYFSSLCTAVTDPFRLADELHAESLVPSPSSIGLTPSEDGPTSKRRQAAMKLLTVVDRALCKDASVLRILIDVLKECLNDSGITAESVRAMELEYSSEGEDFVSIQHAHTVLFTHMNIIASVMTDVVRVAKELANRNILSDQAVCEVQSMLPAVTGYNAPNPELENAKKLLNVVQEEVLMEPGKFAVLIGVLKDNPGTDQNVIAMMEAEYCKPFVISISQFVI